VPTRLRPADPERVEAAVGRFRAGEAADEDVRLLVKHLLALLVRRAPGRAVEVRVPPYAAAQAVGGTTHTRGTPPAVVEVPAATWVALGLGDLSWGEAVQGGSVSASGERSDLSAYLPLV
jgi:hypothetical protein